MLETDDLTPSYPLVNEKQRAAEEALQRIADGKPEQGDYKFTDIDRETVIKLARLHCSGADMARWFGVHEDSIFNRFKEDIETAKAETRARLRKKMLEKAFNGDTTMLIWCSKNWLGFGDNGPVNSDDNKPLPWSDD